MTYCSYSLFAVFNWLVKLFVKFNIARKHSTFVSACKMSDEEPWLETIPPVYGVAIGKSLTSVYSIVIGP